jgi:hypothetical protein
MRSTDFRIARTIARSRYEAESAFLRLSGEPTEPARCELQSGAGEAQSSQAPLPIAIMTPDFAVSAERRVSVRAGIGDRS